MRPSAAPSDPRWGALRACLRSSGRSQRPSRSPARMGTGCPQPGKSGHKRQASPPVSCWPGCLEWALRCGFQGPGDAVAPTPHTREVAGSNPAAPILESPVAQGFLGLRAFGSGPPQRRGRPLVPFGPQTRREMTELLHYESPSVRQGAGGVEAASKPTGSYGWAACTRSPPARWRDAIVRRRAALGPPPH
jgi:hypothetical protein